HLYWGPFSQEVPRSVSFSAEVILPLSMLLMVFGETRARTRRLEAMQAITNSVANAQQYGNVVQCAVQQLKKSLPVRSCWFRLHEGGHLVATHAAGLSAEFLRDAGLAQITEGITKLWEQRTPQVTTWEKADSEPSDCLHSQKIRQVVVVPVV